MTLMPAHDLRRNSAGTPTATSAPWPRSGSRNWSAATRAWRGSATCSWRRASSPPEQGRAGAGVRRSAWACGPAIHADEFCSTGGAELAAELGAASADHLMFASEPGMQAMAAAGVVPNLLPGHHPVPGHARLRPGPEDDRSRAAAWPWPRTSTPVPAPASIPLLVLRLGCLQLRLTFEEAFTAMTLHAARSLGHGDLGHLHPGARAEVLLWDVKQPLDLVYWMGEAFLPGAIAEA